MPLWLIPMLYLWVLNVTTFAVYAYDKVRAIHNKWRVPEKALIGLAFAGGPIGALAGMLVFHHKTQKTKFRVLVPLALVLWTALAALLGVWLLS